ncbi:MAG: hypothetical protein LBJ22_00205 [Synergistaceae bacterium]|jgi:predicted HTH transcriptional regulator|nr:hypothetical protein [Synergistaceae bacterium]
MAFTHPGGTTVSSAGDIRKKDSTFETFLALTENEDRAFLPMEELHRFLPTCCAMANGAGGWIVLGASPESGPQDGEAREGLNGTGKKPITVEGVPNAALLEQGLRSALEDPRGISANPVPFFRSLSSGGKKVLAARVETAHWFLRPLCVGLDWLRGAYRRVEGVNVASGHNVRLRAALDALEIARDDLPVPGLRVSDLDAASVASFRAAVTERLLRWSALSETEWLRRALVWAPENPFENPLDEESGVTRAGQLLLGKGVVRVRMTGRAPASSPPASRTQETWEAQNLWSAWTDLFPKLVRNVSKPCEDALRECFVNSLLHAEHDEGCVEIQMSGDAVVFSNPGLPRARLGEVAVRNGRLLRMLKLAGLAGGEGQGMKIIRALDENFRLRWDTLELRTSAELPLKFEAMKILVVQVPQKKRASILDSMPLPLAELEKNTELPPGLILATLSSEEPEAPQFEIPQVETPRPEAIEPEALEPEALVSEALGSEALESEALEPEVLASEALGFETLGPEILEAEPLQPEAIGSEAIGPQVLEPEPAEDEYAAKEGELEFSSLVQTVRDARSSPAVVRQAILELCGEYQSVSALASALARSEGSLRRRYVSAMVREGLLEMEFPDRVGHADQRYKRVST